MTVMLLEWVCTSAFLILVTLVLRAALGKRIGGAMRYALWAAVLLRLLVPVQLFTSPLAGTWVAAGQRVERDVVEWSAAPTAPAGEALGLPVVDKTPGTVPSAPKAPALPHPPEPPAAPDLSKLAPWLGWAWLAGAGLAALVLLLSNLRFYGQLRRVRTRLEGADCPLAVYAAPGLPSPCLFGLLRPAVYVTPEAADPDMLRHVLAHEYTHYKHGDHIWSLLRCAALAVHWWDPLVWLAAGLSRRDGELACDEGALKRLGERERAAYGATLLALVTAKPSPGDLFRCATTMAGDKKSLKERISRIAAAPKRVVWAIVAAVLVTALACVCAFGQAEPEEEPPAGLEADLSLTLSEAGDTVQIKGTVGGFKISSGTTWSPVSAYDVDVLGNIFIPYPPFDEEDGMVAAWWADEGRTAVTVTGQPLALVTSGKDYTGWRTFTVKLEGENGTITGLHVHGTEGNVYLSSLTDEEAVTLARITARLLTEAEAYYESGQQPAQPEPETETVPAQVRADAEEFVRERFEALRDRGVLFGLDGASVVSDPPEVDDWCIERLAGPIWSGELCWEVLGINRRVELWNVGYAFHTTTPEKAEKSMLTGSTHLMADGWLTQLNYGADYLVYELGEDGSRTLLTTFGEQGEVGSVSFRRSLRAKLAAGGVPGDMADAYFVEEHAELPLGGRELPDLNRDGIPETIQVVGQSDKQRVEIWQGGALLFAEEGFHAHAGWTSLFLYNGGGGDYLLRYHPTMYQGVCDYSYQLFTLENGRETVAREDSLEFDINFQPWLHEKFDPEAIAAFLDDVNGLLSHSVQLLNTDEYLLSAFEKNGRLYDDLWWLDAWKPVFARDEGKTLRENLRDFQAAMEAEWNDPWGLILTAGAPSPTGVILNFHQAGGEPTGTLQYGSYYWLEREEEGGGWVKVPVVLDLSENWYWTQESYLIPMNAQTSEEVDWSGLYGELSPGRYRIGKEVMDFRGGSDYDILNYYAEFSVDRT